MPVILTGFSMEQCRPEQWVELSLGTVLGLDSLSRSRPSETLASILIAPGREVNEGNSVGWGAAAQHHPIQNGPAITLSSLGQSQSWIGRQHCLPH